MLCFSRHKLGLLAFLIAEWGVYRLARQDSKPPSASLWLYDFKAPLSELDLASQSQHSMCSSQQPHKISKMIPTLQMWKMALADPVLGLK